MDILIIKVKGCDCQKQYTKQMSKFEICEVKYVLTIFVMSKFEKEKKRKEKRYIYIYIYNLKCLV